MEMQTSPEQPASAERPAPENVISELRRSYDELTLSQKRIAEVIVEDPEFVAFATVDKLAVRLGVSPSTIVRFAYRLRLDGYPDLQERVRQVVRMQLRREGGETGGRQTSTEHLGDGVFAQSLAHDMDNLERTIRGLSAEQLGKAIDALVEARRVYITGAATSRSVAEYAGVALGRVRRDVLLMGAGEQAMTSLLDMNGEDALLALTFPPYAASTLRSVTSAQELGAVVVGITDSPISPVGQRADILLPAVAAGIGTQNSLVGAMAVANALLNGVAGRSPTAVERYGRSTKLVNQWSLFLLEGEEDD